MSVLDLFNYKNPPDTLQVQVTPKAKSERIKRVLSADGTDLYRIYVTAAPEDGKANEAVIKLLSKALGIAKSNLSIIRGHTSRHKVIKISL